MKYKRNDLLKHPAVTSLLDYKWTAYGGFLFLINFITYLIFLLFLTTYALLLPHPDHSFCEYILYFMCMWSYSNCSMVCIMCSYDENLFVAYLVATYLLKIICLKF